MATGYMQGIVAKNTRKKRKKYIEKKLTDLQSSRVSQKKLLGLAVPSYCQSGRDDERPSELFKLYRHILPPRGIQIKNKKRA
jgi:hypothetical protein